MGDTILHDFLDVVYQAAVDERQWERIIGEIERRFPFTFASLAFYDGQIDKGGIHTFADCDAGFLDQYNLHYATVNPWVKINMTTPVGPVLCSRDFLATKELRKTEFFNDWLRFNKNVDEGLGCTLYREDDRLALFGVHYNSSKTADEDRAALMHFLEQSAPHLQRAMSLRRQLEGKTLYANKLEATLDRLDVGVALVAANGKLEFANTEAERIFATAGAGISILRGKLYIRNTATQDEVYSALRVATQNETAPSETRNSVFNLPDGRGRSFIVSIFPMVADLPNDRTFDSYGVLAERHALVFVSDTGKQLKNIDELVRLAFGLSPAEARLAIAIANGETVKGYSEKLEVSQNTVRNQRQSILDKMQLNRQSELSAMITKTFGNVAH